MKRILVAVGLGVVGVVFALGLTVGALAVAGPDVGEPPTVPVLDRAGDTSVTPSPSAANPDKGGNRDDDRNGKNDDRGSPKPTDSPTPETSTDDHSGASSDDSPSEDHDAGSNDSGSEDHGTDPGDHEEPDDD